MNKGYLHLGRWRGAPIRIHWTTPLGAIVFSGFEIAPGLWLGFLLLVLIHELGHATVVRLCRQRVVSVDIHGLGGVCRWHGEVTPIRRASIAWGGVWAQMLLLAATLLWKTFAGAPSGVFIADLVRAFVQTNVMLMGLNLMPIAPLDGAEAWALPGLLLGRWRRARALRRAGRRRAALRAEIATLETLDEEGAVVTPEVVDVLERAREIARREAGSSRRLPVGRDEDEG